MKYNNYIVHEFALKRVENPETGMALMYLVAFVGIISLFVTLFANTKNVINNRI